MNKYRYILTRKKGSSDKFGRCEICGKLKPL